MKSGHTEALAYTSLFDNRIARKSPSPPTLGQGVRDSSSSNSYSLKILPVSSYYSRICEEILANSMIPIDRAEGGTPKHSLHSTSYGARTGTVTLVLTGCSLPGFIIIQVPTEWAL